MSKSFSLTIPRLTSITKSNVSSKTNNKRASASGSGRVLMVRPTAKKIASRNRINNVNLIRTVSVVGIATLALSFGFYVFMINAYASKGYELKKHQASIQELQETNKRLVVEQSALGSIVKINDVASAAHMVPVTGEEFLVANQVSAR